MVITTLTAFAQMFGAVAFGCRVSDNQGYLFSRYTQIGLVPTLQARDDDITYDGLLGFQDSYNSYELNSTDSTYDEVYYTNVVTAWGLKDYHTRFIVRLKDYYDNAVGDYYDYYYIDFEQNVDNGTNYTSSYKITKNFNSDYFYNVELIFTAFYTIDGEPGQYNYVSFSLPLWKNTNSTAWIPLFSVPHTQYTVTYVTMSAHLVDIRNINEYNYDRGYDDGYTEGVSDGYQDGYTHGYGVGKDEGFALGQGSGNSFRSLFGTLIDTPIIYLRKLFDYELFGISVFKALATVISLIVALSVFRLVRGIF